MPATNPPLHPARRWRASARGGTVAVAVAAVLAACAQLPSPIEAATSRPAGTYATQTTFDAPVTSWPVDRWWTAYGDPQLDVLVLEALTESPDLAIAHARLRAAGAVAEIAGAALKPQGGLGAEVNEQRFSKNYLTPAALVPDGWNDLGRVAAQASWELDFWGRQRHALAAATSARQAAEAEAAQARLLIASAVASQYAELARLSAQRETVGRSVAVRAQTAALAAERHAHGLETRGNVRQADALRAAAEGRLLALDEQLVLQRHRIAALLGQGPDRGLAISTPGLSFSRPYGLPPTLAADLLGRRPDIVAARQQAQAASSRIGQARAAFYPNVNLTALLGVQSLGLDLLARGGSVIGSVGPAVSLPLFTGGRLRGELKGAQAGHDEAVARYDATVTRALQEVADAAVSLKWLEPRLGKADEAVAAAQEAHHAALDRYRGGLASFLEALSAEESLLASLSAQTDLRAASLTLDIALQRALGGGYQTEPALASAGD